MSASEMPGPGSDGGVNRRRDTRFAGPFEGWRVGLLETPLRFFDLSRGGCFVDSMHEQPPGTRLTMKIVLPEVGAITLKGETLYERSGFGFAVRFVDIEPETEVLLDRAIEALQRQTSPAWQPRAESSATRDIVPLAEVLTNSHERQILRSEEPPAAPPAPASASKSVDRPRASRLGMVGSGYRVLVDDEHVSFVNLSLSGVQIRGAVELTLGQPVLMKIGWPQDHVSFTAIARVRWVQPESDAPGAISRIGLEFETWDVRRLREIMGSRSSTSPVTAELVGTW